MSGGAGVAAVHFVDEVVDGVGHAGYLRGDAGLVGAESLVLDRVEGRHDEIELAAVVRHSLDGGIDGRQPGLKVVFWSSRTQWLGHQSMLNASISLLRVSRISSLVFRRSSEMSTL